MHSGFSKHDIREVIECTSQLVTRTRPKLRINWNLILNDLPSCWWSNE